MVYGWFINHKPSMLYYRVLDVLATDGASGIPYKSKIEKPHYIPCIVTSSAI